jgi:hypothetical protein
MSPRFRVTFFSHFYTEQFQVSTAAHGLTKGTCLILKTRPVVDFPTFWESIPNALCLLDSLTIRKVMLDWSLRRFVWALRQPAFELRNHENSTRYSHERGLRLPTLVGIGSMHLPDVDTAGPPKRGHVTAAFAQAPLAPEPRSCFSPGVTP